MKQNSSKLILVGGGGHCKAVIDVIELIGKFEIIGIIDKEDKVGGKILGYEIIGTDSELVKFLKYKDIGVLITVGAVKIEGLLLRKRLYEYVKQLGFQTPNLISPLSYVSKHASLGDGNVIMHNALINAGAQIGNNCIINTKALIEHDAIVENHCHVATGAIINGGVIVKDCSFIGSNSTSKEYTQVSGFAKAGSVLT